MTNQHLLIHAYGLDPEQLLATTLRVTRNAHTQLGTRARLHLVVQGPAVKLLTLGSVHRTEIEEILALPEVEILACENSMSSANITDSDLLTGIQTVPSAVAYLAEKQWEGWAYVRF